MSDIKYSRERPEGVDLFQKKGKGTIFNEGAADRNLVLHSLTYEKRTQVAATDTATLTTAQMLAGIIDDTATAAATLTSPTAAQMVAAVPNCKVGSSFFFVINAKAATHTITFAGGTGVTTDGTLTAATGTIRLYLFAFTNVTPGSEAAICYGIE